MINNLNTINPSITEDTLSLSNNSESNLNNNNNDNNNPQQSENIEMKDLDKSEYTKIPDVLITEERTRTPSDLSISDVNSYLQPSIEDQNGRVSYLQDLEDLPQGRHLGLFSTIVLFVSRILGSGIFSITSGIYQDCGQSVFLFFSAWFVAGVASFGDYMFFRNGIIGSTKWWCQSILGIYISIS